MIHDAAALLDEAQRDPNFLGNANMHDNHTWRAGPDGLTEYLVPNSAATITPSALQPSVLKTIVQIKRYGFFATPDFKFNPARLASWQEPMGAVAAFRRGDMSFIVGSVPEADHPELSGQYHQTVQNMEVLRLKVLPRVTHFGAYLGEGQDARFKISHSGFEERPVGEPVPEASNTSSGSNSGATENQHNENAFINPHAWADLDQDVDFPFRIVNLLPVVSSACRPLLRELIPTTRFNPLPAVVEHDPVNGIHPAQYGTVLPGAIIELSFTLSHKMVNRAVGRASFFKATVDRIKVLETSATISPSPSKSLNQQLFRRKRADPPVEESAGPSKSKRTRKA